MKNKIESILDYHFFSEIDRQLAFFINRLNKKNNPELVLAVALLSRAMSEGDVCLSLELMANKKFSDLPQVYLQETEPDFTLPPLENWLKKISTSQLVFNFQKKTNREIKPLVLDYNNRFYFYRYWSYEQQLAKNLRHKINTPQKNFEEVVLQKSLEKYFNQSESEKEKNQQQVAFSQAIKNNFCFISGGPGTGKTFTAAKIILGLLDQAAAKQKPIRIALTAPTGKAALKLNDSILKIIPQNNLASNICETFTIHRLLGLGLNTSKTGIKNLPYETIIVDEASMIDLSLMNKLLNAVSPNTKLILLGDKDQLASVEAGSVLGDIASFLKEDQPDLFIELKKNYRFRDRPDIEKFNSAVKKGNYQEVKSLLKNGQKNIRFKKISSPQEFLVELTKFASNNFNYLKNIESLPKMFSNSTKLAILSPFRKGLWGTEFINQKIESVLADKNIIPKNKNYYPGQPLLIKKNDYNLNLFNGDLGIIYSDQENPEELKVYFQDKDINFKFFKPNLLPACDKAYALTVHKSQGSEFEKIILVLPDASNPLLTKELFYTAISRAKEEIMIWGTEEVIDFMIKNRVKRTSGLQEAIGLAQT